MKNKQNTKICKWCIKCKQNCKTNIVIYIIVIVVISIPFILKWVSNLYNWSLKGSDWLGFLGSYIAGIITLYVFTLTIKKDIKINNFIITRQWNERNLIEFKNILTANLKLFNTADLKESLANTSDLQLTKNIILNKKKQIFNCDADFQLKYLMLENEFKQYNTMNYEIKSALDDYKESWDKIKDDLANFLDAVLNIKLTFTNLVINKEDIVNNSECNKDHDEILKKIDKDINPKVAELVNLTLKLYNVIGKNSPMKIS